jgi:phospholipase C
MTQYAYLGPSIVIELSPGDLQMYRLPTMSPGEFHLYAKQLGVITVPPPDPGGHGIPVQPGQPTTPVLRAAGGRGSRSALRRIRGGPMLPIGPGGGGGGGGGGGSAVVDLKMDLYHGDHLVVSGSNDLPLQLTPSDGDDTWRVQLQLAPGAPEGTYSYNVSLNPFPSMFPLLTRRIPLAFFQQGFDNNWNGRNYISLEFEGGDLMIRFDQELASYYGLSNLDYVLGSIPTMTFPNIQISDIRLRMDSSDSGYDGLTGKLPFVLLTVKFTGINNQPITGSFLGLDFSVQPFSVNVKFFLTTFGPDPMGSVVGYITQVGTDLIEKLDTNFAYKDYAQDKVNSLIKSAQTFLDGHALQVGEAITPWLLGASFAVYRVSYDPTNSQPVPPDGPQGDLVIHYVGQLPPARSGMPGSVDTLDFSTMPLTLSQANPASGVLSTPYSYAFLASGGTPPYSWTIGGAMPPGLTVNGSSLSGTPTAAGAYSVAVTVSDSAGAQASQTQIVAINTPDLAITTNDPLPRTVITHPYAMQLVVQGAPGAHYTWSAVDLPDGLSMLAHGVIEGIPSGDSRNATFLVQATASSGVSAWKVFSIRLDDPPLFPDVVYAPRGDGDTIWKPNVPEAPIEPGHLAVHTTPGNLGKVDHIVLVMMENRSFDHMLGYLSREGGRSDIEGLKWESEADATQYNFYKGKYYYPKPLTDTHIINIEALSPDHSHEAVKAQMADGMKHFVSDYAKTKAGDDPDQLQIAMGYYGASQLPFYDLLARNYAVCDHWFCSHPGPTWPNRFVAMTGDLNRDSWGEPEVNTPDYTTFTPSEAVTLFDLLSDRGVSWMYFQQRESMMRAFTKYSFDMVNVREYSDPANGFRATVNSGLPKFTWVDPLFGDLPAGINSPQDNDDAPPSDLKFGQLFIQEVYHTLFSRETNPNGWDKTMLIVVYDEHGGFYDHVDPPSNATPLLGQNSGKLGPRVPAFVISPFTPRGLVLKNVFDHGTIAATVLRRFCSPNPPFMSARVSAAADLRDALPLAAPRGHFSTGQIVVPGEVTALARTAIRRFRVPSAPDSFGPMLGGIALALGSTPG